MAARNVLFVSSGTHAFGESIMALNLARNLDRERFRPLFVVSPLNSVLLEEHPDLATVQLIEGAIKVNQLLVEDFLEHNRPDLIILCDFLTFAFSQTRFGITLDLLRRYEVPIISLDSYEWESGDFSLDFFNGVVRKVPDTLRDLDGALRPCPLNKPQDPTGRSICYSFLHQLNSANGNGAEPSVRQELGVPDDAVLLLTAEAIWQKLRPKAYGGVFGDLVEEMIAWYIARLDREAHWIRIGPQHTSGTVQRGKVTEHNITSLPERQFDRLVAAADLLVSTNVASTTLAKCLRYGTNCLLLYNSVLAVGPGDLEKYDVRISGSMRARIEDAYPLHPFLMYPLGWHRFLGPVLESNPYLDTFFQVEILDDEKVMSILEQAAGRQLSEPEEARRQYVRTLEELPDANECMDFFLRT